MLKYLQESFTEQTGNGACRVWSKNLAGNPDCTLIVAHRGTDFVLSIRDEQGGEAIVRINPTEEFIKKLSFSFL